jgi:hypothetical protein
MRKPIQNIGASIRARLLNLSKERNQPFELLLTRYTLERLLYRLSKSKHREKFGIRSQTDFFSIGGAPRRRIKRDPLAPLRF